MRIHLNLLRRSAPLLVLLIALCAAPPVGAAPAGASAALVAEQNLSHTPDHSEDPRIAYGGGRVFAIWGERDRDRLGFSTAAADGAWSPAEFFDTGTLTKYQPPDVVADGSGTAHIVYASGDQVFYRSRGAAGNWSAPVPVATDRVPVQMRITRAPDGTLWVTWHDSGGANLRYRFSTDGGQTWRVGGDDGLISHAAGLYGTSVAVDGSNAPHVFWHIRGGYPGAGTIYYADWNGSRFAVRKFTLADASRYNCDPEIIVSPQNVQHMVWRQQVGLEWAFLYAVRPPGGEWQQAEQLALTDAGGQWAAAIGTDERGDIVVSHSERDGNTRRIALMVQRPGGGWQSFHISDGPQDNRSAVVASVTGGSVFAHVLYQHERRSDDGEIVYARVLLEGLPAPAPLPSAQPAPAPAPQPAPSGGGLEAALQPGVPRSDCSFFAETRHNLCGAFRSYWRQFGGLPIYGYPLTEEYVENGVVTQYFERARFEYHPGAIPARFDVLLGLLGSERVAGRREAGEPAFQPAAARGGCTFFAETQHNLCGAFRSYWRQFGGLMLYGYPLTDEFVENGLTVQYFERARFEYHPGASPRRFDIMAGRIGAERLGR